MCLCVSLWPCPPQPPPRVLHAALSLDGALLVFGGRGASGEDENERPLLVGVRQRRWEPLRGGERGGMGVCGAGGGWGSMG